jgi:glyoxylase-like metal-dependent hydrolase (beta-lactamase superfamily II)
MALAEPNLHVIPYFSPESQTTTYIVSRRGGSLAMLVDPVHVNRDFLQILLQHDLTVQTVCITHPEAYMRHALRTLQKIFDFRVIAGSTDLPVTVPIHDLDGEEEIDCCDFTLRAIPFLPHSRSSYIYHVESLVFTGSIVHAGTLGETANAFSEALLVATVKDHLFSLPEGTLMLPSVGPPSTLKAEQMLSPYYREEL